MNKKKERRVLKKKRKRSQKLKNLQLMGKERTMLIKLVLYQNQSQKNLKKKDQLLISNKHTSNSSKPKVKIMKMRSFRTEMK